MVTVVAIGWGGWSRNHVRNFHESRTCRLKTTCDLNEKVLSARSR